MSTRAIEGYRLGKAHSLGTFPEKHSLWITAMRSQAVVLTHTHTYC